MTLKWSEFALIRTAHQVACPCERAKLTALAKQAEAGDRVKYQELKEYALTVAAGRAKQKT